MIARRFAQRLVRFYPRAWRARYEQEMLALLEQGSAGWKDVFDLAAGGASEWVRTSEGARSLIAPAWASVCCAAAVGIVALFRQAEIEAPADARDIAAYLHLAVMLSVFGVACAPRVRQGMRSLFGRRPRTYPRVPIGTFWMVALTIGLVAMAALRRWPSSVPIEGGLENVFFNSLFSVWLGFWTIVQTALSTWAQPTLPHTVSTGRAEADNS